MKNIFKKKTEEHYLRKIDSMFEISVKALTSEQYDYAMKNDAQLIKMTARLARKNLSRKTRKRISEYWLSYITLLTRVNAYQKDGGAINPSLNLICDNLLSEDNIAVMFDNKRKTEFVTNIMISITTRPDSYNDLYNRFITNLNPTEKSKALVRLFSSPAGSIDYEKEIKSLLKEYKGVVYDRYQKETELDQTQKSRYKKETTAYVTDINNIARRTFSTIEDEDIICHELDDYAGDPSDAIVALIGEAIAANKCIDAIQQWINSVEKNGRDLTYAWGYYRVKGWLYHYKTGNRQRWKEGNVKQYSLPWLRRELRRKGYSEQEKYDVCMMVYSMLSEACSNENSCLDKMKIVDNLFEVKEYLRCYSYWVKFRNALDCVETKEHTYSDVVFCAPFRRNTLINASYALPILLEGKKKGGTLISMSAGTFDSIDAETELDEICRYREGGAVFQHYDASILRHPLEIDFDNKKIMLGEYNVYEPIYEEASRCQFTIDFNFLNDAWVRARCYRLLFMCDRAIEQCENIEKYAVKNGKKVFYLLTSYHMYEFAAIRIYCETRGYKYGMKAIGTRSGYDDYFTSKPTKSETISMLNLTDNPTKRLPFFGTDDGFESFYNNHLNEIDSMRKKADKWFKQQRSNRFDSNNTNDESKRKLIIDKIKAHKERGGKVYLLIGKLVFDLCVYYTKGTAHKDMSDWATDVVKTISKNDNILLLIKPHPHETRSDVTMSVESITTFRDIIKCDLPNNSIYLDGHLFRNIDLFDYVDLGITWNSTSSLELAANDIKVIMGDVFGYYDYPIGIPRYNTREEYENALLNIDSVNVPKNLSDRAICFLNYMGSEFVSIPNPYTTTTTTNYHTYEAGINMDAINIYNDCGDVLLEEKVSQTFGI